MTEPGPLRADGERVWVASATEADVDAYIRATLQSSRRLREWNPVDPYGLPSLLRTASAYHRTLLVHARQSDSDHDLVGKVNVTNVVRGRALSATLGYDAFDPYAGRGLFAEGLGIVVDLAFTPESRGMGLHRLEANVQPANVRSAAVLRRLGFRREGFSPSFLLMPTTRGSDEWRDHDRYAVTRAEWPAAPWAPPAYPRIAALVNGIPGSGTTTLARRLAADLGLPLYSESTGADAASAVWRLLADSPPGGVVESWIPPQDRHHVVDGLRQAGLEARSVPEVWCEVPVVVARARFAERSPDPQRHPKHAWPMDDDGFWARVADAAAPLGIGPVLAVDTTREVGEREIGQIALQVRAAFA